MHHYAFNKRKQIDVTVQRIFGKRILPLYLYFGKYTKNHSLGQFLMAKKNGNNISAVHPFVSKHIFLNFYRGTSQFEQNISPAFFKVIICHPVKGSLFLKSILLNCCFFQCLPFKGNQYVEISFQERQILPFPKSTHYIWPKLLRNIVHNLDKLAHM